MTTTIDTNGRTTGDTTPTRVLDLRPGDVIQTSWDADDMAEVLLTTPVERSPGLVLLVMSGGYFEQTDGDTMYQVVTGDRAERWRAYREAAARCNAFADQIADLSLRFRVGDLPMPQQYVAAFLTVDVASEAEVEQAAKTLGVQMDRTEREVSAFVPAGEGDLSVRFQHYIRAEAAT